MKLESQVVSLELAKKLKDLGVGQKSLFYWQKYEHGWTIQPAWLPRYSKNSGTSSALTVAELGELLPKSYVSGQTNWDEEEKQFSCHWYMVYRDGRPNLNGLCEMDHRPANTVFSNTEANARAKMLIYLLENDLMKIPNEK